MFKKKILPIILFVLLLVGMACFQYIPILIFDLDVENFSKTMTIWYTFCCDVGFILIILAMYFRVFKRDFKNYISNFSENFMTSFRYYFIGLVGMLVSNIVITLFFSNATANNEDAVRSLIDLYPLYMIFSVSIYAPIVEETIFRKCIKDSVLAFGDNKFTKYLYILISGLIFSSLHVLGMVTSNLDYLYIIPYFSLGALFAALYYRTDNIFSSIVMHSLHNTVAVILYLVTGGLV